MKLIFGNLGTRVWFIVTVAVVALLVAVTVLTTAVFYELLNSVMPGGGERPVYAANATEIYTRDEGYSNKEEAVATSNLVNERICEEGFVLLKNEGNALPLATPVSDEDVTERPAVSVFGKNSVNIAYGGSGSGGVRGDGVVSLYDSLSEAGYDTNPVLRAFYEDTSRSGPARAGNSTDLDSGVSVAIATAETPQSMYTDEVRASYADYSDAAIVVLTRIGGEGFDLPRYQGDTEGASSPDDHYLEPDKNELDMLSAVCNAGFDRVIVLINSGSAMELAFLEDPERFADADKIDAAVWMGFPGTTGTRALGKILNGSVSPSGKTADTYASDFTASPAFENFGDGNFGDSVYDEATGIWVTNDQYMTLNADGDATPENYFFVDYEEGVYVGYKYYETRGADDEEWYADNVVYPFGYGLSYTKFSVTVEDASSVRDVAIEGNRKYTVSVRVTNTGSMPGREVVQLYGHAPYTPGETEKPEVTLLDFAKTDVILPGEENSVVLELTFDPYLLASYDYKGLNDNSAKTFELDASDDYMLYIARDAHDRSLSVPFRVASDIIYDEDPVTGNPVRNRYTDMEDPAFNSDTHLSTVLSRSDWSGTWPTAPTEEDRIVDAEYISMFTDTSHNNPTDFNSMPMPWFDEPADMRYSDMLPESTEGLPLDGSPIVSYKDDRWQTLLEQCSFAELQYMVSYGAFQSPALLTIGKPATLETDGPVGFVNFMDRTGSTYFGTCNYCCEVVIASTWNKDRAYDFGVSVGNEGLLGNTNTGTPYTGWYAPGVNIHRTPFGGRNFEYFSEDGVLAGKMAGAQIRGAQSKGIYCYVKHFALNEQETHRSLSGDASWVTEQAMREIFLRPFELAVKEGGTRAIMSSFNRIGTRWTGGDYRLLTEILRDEWGFRGTVICDFNTIPAYMNSRQMAYAGGDLNLATQPVLWGSESDTADTVILMQCAKNILYTVVNSAAREVVGYDLPIWTILLIVFDCVVVVGLGVWGVFAVRKALKKKQS